jgi:hypothetical protein
MRKNINNILKLLVLTSALAFSYKANAQEVNVVTNKGTITTVNNNRVFTQNTDPNNPTTISVEGDIWIDTSSTPNLVKVWDGSWITLPTSSHSGTAGSVFFADSSGNPTENNSDFNWNDATSTLSSENIDVSGTYADSDGDVGTNGQVLSSTGTGTNWVDNSTTSTTVTQQIGYIFSTGLTRGSDGSNLYNINSSVTRNGTGDYSVTFSSAHPDGSNYSVTFGTEHNDGAIPRIASGTRTANGFDVEIIRNNGNNSFTDPTTWSFNVTAEMSVVTSIGSTPTGGSGTTPTGTPAPTTGASAFGPVNLYDTDAGNRFQLQFNGPNTADSTSYEIFLDNVPYRLTNFSLGNHTVTENDNGDGTYDYLFTSTTPIGGYNQYRQIDADQSAAGTGNSCGCISFYTIP